MELHDIARQYKALEEELKAGMVQLGHTQIDLGKKGRVFISQSERVVVPPKLLRDVIGALAEVIIQKKESVPNHLVKAFVETGQINEDQREQLMAEAEKTMVVSLYVRPLK